ncbi:uncharacterized protein [Typha latifolia]|uniref:uncharacterized protein n=1 Tax=Typha latifolia TaxID=4733 RepID=UPI003C2C164B
MRRFFSFRSSVAGNGNTNAAPPESNHKTKEEKIPTGEIVCLSSQTPDESGFKSRKRYSNSKDSSNPHLRRSLSFSSPAAYGDLEEGELNFSGNLSGSSSTCLSAPHHIGKCPFDCHTLNPERLDGMRGSELTEVQKSYEVQEIDSPGSKSYVCSSGRSCYSPPVALRCRPARLPNFSNKNEVLDLYIDGEQDTIRPNENQQNSSETSNDSYLDEKIAVPCSGKPPLAQSTAPSSPTSIKESHRTYSFGNMKDVCLPYNLTRESGKDNLRRTSHHRNSRRHNESLAHPFQGKLIKSQDYESQTTTTVEDIYEDSSDAHPSSDFSSTTQMHLSSLSLSHEISNGYWPKQLQGCQRKTGFIGKKFTGIKQDSLPNLASEEQDTDEKLLRKAKEVDEKFMILSEENSEFEMLRNKTSSLPALLQLIENMNEDRKYLVLELSSQIKSRLSERYSAKEQYRQSKVELDTRTRRLEKEKTELQSTLDKELDRRSNDWSLKLAKFQSEEQRLRERVRELAEQNVSLQREVSSRQANEAETRSRITNSEMQLKELTAMLEKVSKENHDINKFSTELQDHITKAEDERDHLKRSYKAKVEENKELQKVVVGLQRIRSEQDKTITALRQGYSEELGKKSIESGDNINRLQMELIRLTGVEQMLRREVESCRLEIESLRHENISFLNRLQSSGSGSKLFSIRLDEELRGRVDYLQTQGISLLDDNSYFCAKLLEFIKSMKHENSQEPTLEGYSLMEHMLKHQTIKRGIESFKRSLQTIKLILDDKSSLEASESMPRTIEGGLSGQQKDQASEDDMELKLKAEVMLTRVLREKLCSKELELEQLHAELAYSVRGYGVQQNEIQRLQDELSCLNHKAKEMEFQMLKKDENINQTQQDLQECMKEINALRGTLKTVTEERDFVWQEAKQLRKTNVLMQDDMKTLRKKIEALDEDILLKEGQLSILKDSIDKPFNIICSPKTMKEFDMD